MKSLRIAFSLLCMMFATKSFSQISNFTILNDLKAEITKADTASKNRLMTDMGFNVFIQKKTMNYLTGASDLSLSKVYVTYGSDKEKLDVGFNIPFTNSDGTRLKLLLNPILQANMKNSFSTLYKDGEWKNDIRGGMKLTFFISNSFINFYDRQNGVNNLKVVRSKTYNSIKDGFNKAIENDTESVSLVSNPDLKVEMLGKGDLSDKDWEKKREKAFVQLGEAEASFVEKEREYSIVGTSWFSFWSFFPMSEAEKYISIDNTQPFEKVKFNFWELNFQYTYLLDHSRFGTFYFTPWVKYFQNNSASADLMDEVDYGKYSQFPGVNPQNLALLETNKAYIGEYDEFMTTNLNVQVVYMVGLRNTLLKPGVSLRFEKNFGDYHPANIRIGVPITIQGKEKPFNVELQYRFNDIFNYDDVEGHKSTKIFGVNLGLPISLLY